VSGARVVAAVNVNVAILFVASSATVPVGLTHGAAQVTLKLAAPLIGAIGSLNVAATVVLTGTPAALLRGATAVTIGASVATPVPNTASRLQPAATRPSSNAVNHAVCLENPLNARIEVCS
jgi:hypothetical protein